MNLQEATQEISGYVGSKYGRRIIRTRTYLVLRFYRLTRQGWLLAKRDAYPILQKYSYWNISTASESIIDVWFKNRTNIDDDGYIIDYNIVEKGRFDYLRCRVDGESGTDGLSEVFGLSDEDDDPPSIMPTYNLDDF